MLRIAIVETEEITKDIIFSLRLNYTEDFVFHYYTKLSLLNKDQQDYNFQVIFFHGKFDVPRIHSAFVHEHRNRLVIFCDHVQSSPIGLYSNVMHINRNDIKNEMERVVRFINQILKSEQHYLFSYNQVSVALKMNEIYYIEKDNKNLIYHTKRGIFSERKSMKDIEAYFSQYSFIRIHSTYMVNFTHIERIESDVVWVHNQELPIARARKNEVFIRMKALTDGK